MTKIPPQYHDYGENELMTKDTTTDYKTEIERALHEALRDKIKSLFSVLTLGAADADALERYQRGVQHSIDAHRKAMALLHK